MALADDVVQPYLEDRNAPQKIFLAEPVRQNVTSETSEFVDHPKAFHWQTDDTRSFHFTTITCE
jgi:hypothetical protein